MSKLNTIGKIEIKDGRKIIARIYNRPVFFEGKNIRYPSHYPYNLELPHMGLSRECETLEEVNKYLFTYTGHKVPEDEMPIPEIDFTRVNSDYNGNPRYVCHYTNFVVSGANESYEVALARARKLGGRKFHNKQYGGGIVFSFFEGTREFSKRIYDLMKAIENGQ